MRENYFRALNTILARPPAGFGGIPARFMSVWFAPFPVVRRFSSCGVAFSSVHSVSVSRRFGSRVSVRFCPMLQHTKRQRVSAGHFRNAAKTQIPQRDRIVKSAATNAKRAKRKRNQHADAQHAERRIANATRVAKTQPKRKTHKVGVGQ